MRKLINTEKYELGDVRIKKGFLFLPKTLKNKNGEYEKRWLEFSKWEEKVWTIYKKDNKKIEHGWYETRWLNE